MPALNFSNFSAPNISAGKVKGAGAEAGSLFAHARRERGRVMPAVNFFNFSAPNISAGKVRGKVRGKVKRKPLFTLVYASKKNFSAPLEKLGPEKFASACFLNNFKLFRAFPLKGGERPEKFGLPHPQRRGAEGGEHV